MPSDNNPTAEDGLTSTQAFGDGINYAQKKNSLETDPSRREGFQHFAETYCPNIVDAGSLEASTPPLPLLTPELGELLAEINEHRNETDSYFTYACLLTRLSLHLCEGSEDALAFRPYSESTIRGTLQSSGNNKPDLIAYFAPYDPTKKLIDNKWELQALADDEKERFKCKVSVQEMSSFVECKTQGAEISGDKNQTLLNQVLRYLYAIFRQNPGSCLQYGLTVDKRGFQLVAFGLDECAYWTKVHWDDAEWLGKLLTCMKMIVSQARACFNPANKAIPKLQRTFPVKSHFIALYSATVDGKQFRLIPLFYGRGNGRKPFVALAVAVDNPNDVRVFKYSWCTSAQKGRERRILEQLLRVPGIVQIDTDLSMEEIEKESKEGGRTLGLVVLKTVGRPLSSCRSVREFLVAMFDLIEVLRNLDQKGIIHRDVSWGNVLIPLELPGTSAVNNRNSSTQAALPDVDPLGPMSQATAPKAVSTNANMENAGNERPCRFLSAVLGGNYNEPRVALADFDHATNCNDSNADLKNVTGTPMFMAVDVLRRRGIKTMLTKGPTLHLRHLTILNNDYAELYGDDVNEKKKWDEYYRVTLHNLEWIAGELQFEKEISELDEELARLFKHQAVHDVESVFYLCVLFFVRMWPKGAIIPESRRAELQRKRGDLFRKLISKEIGQPMVDLTESLEFIIEDVDISQMEDFQAMLEEMWYYIRVPWYNVKNTGKGEVYEYHSHDALRRILLRRIKRLDTERDEIVVEENPLIVKISGVTRPHYTPTAFLISNVPSASEKSRDIRDNDPKSGQKRSSEAAVSEISGASKRPRGSREASSSTRPTRDTVTDESTGVKMINPVDESPKWDVPEDIEDLRMFVDLAWQIARSVAWFGL